jgi:hypothetical protein
MYGFVLFHMTKHANASEKPCILKLGFFLFIGEQKSGISFCPPNDQKIVGSNPAGL